MAVAATASKSLMYQPGTTSKMIGKPAWWESRCQICTFSRPCPLNSGISSEIGVVSANCPSSIARSTRTLVNALVIENRLNTESRLSGCLCCIGRADGEIQHQFAAAGDLHDGAVVQAGGDVRLDHRLQMLQALPIHRRSCHVGALRLRVDAPR
jgi:hypothetical protein